jgi:hypothetical protein
MSRIEPILKAAMLGTEKWMPPLDGLPHSIGAFIEGNSVDREDAFLKYAGLLLTCDEAGSLPAEAPHAIEPCPTDQLPPLKNEKAGLLRECLATGDDLLIGYLAQKSRETGCIAPGDTIPGLLDMAVQHKKLRVSILAFTGSAGKWLTQFNTHWQQLPFSTSEEMDENTWETGNETERIQFLETLRKQNASKAIELLEKAFPQENAATRLSFLQTLHINKSTADEPFLLSLLSDKSKQVKQEAQFLLKTIPGTRLNQLFLDYCTTVCSIREERYMLLAKKKVLHIANNMEPSKELFDAGINKVSSLKGMADHLLWFAEALAYTPPDALAAALGISAETLLDLLLASKELEPLRIHFTFSAIHFGHTGWVRQLIAEDLYINSALLNILPYPEALQHLPKLMKTEAGEVLKMTGDHPYVDFHKEIARDFFELLKEQPYAIQKQDYRKLALCFPVSSLGFIQQLLESGATQNINPYFINNAMEMEKIISAKKIFNL